MDIILIGFGNVGQGFAHILRDKVRDLRERYGFTPRLVAVITRSHGALYHKDGLDITALLESVNRGNLTDYPSAAGLLRDLEPARLIHDFPADVMVEASPSDFATAEPALGYCYAALNSGKHVVLANKGPVALDYSGLKRAAERARRSVFYEATVMAGTPVLRTALAGLAGCTITRVRGILNGTTNYILTQMQNGSSYADALAQAQKLGYAETDPSADVDGLDAAGKLAILSAVLFGTIGGLEGIDITGITGITRDNVLMASEANERWKLIAEATPDGARVQPMRLSQTDPLANVSGATNAITFTTDLMGDVTVIGAGAGRKETGAAILSDLLALYRERR